MKSGKRVLGVIIVSLLLIVSIGLVSAAWKDWFGFGNKNENLTGELPVSFDIGITMQNQAPSINGWYIAPGTPGRCTNVDITGNTNFQIRLVDPDGWSDLQDANVYVNFTKAGQTRPTGGYATCTPIAGTGVGNSLNFTCTINMNYYDPAGIDWVVLVAANDGNPATGYAAQKVSSANKSYDYFTYQSSTDIIFQESPQSGAALDKTIDWASVMTTSAELEGSNHLNISNCGNWNLNVITVTAKNLTGVVYAGNFDAKSFSVSASTFGSVQNPCANLTKTNLSTDLPGVIANNNGTTLPAGTYSIATPKLLNFCINDVNPADPTPITVDTYRSTANPWDIAWS